MVIGHLQAATARTHRGAETRHVCVRPSKFNRVLLILPQVLGKNNVSQIGYYNRFSFKNNFGANESHYILLVPASTTHHRHIGTYAQTGCSSETITVPILTLDHRRRPVRSTAPARPSKIVSCSV